MTTTAPTTVRELQEERQALWVRMQDIMGEARKANRAMDEAESKTYEELGQQIDGFATRIAQIEDYEKRQRDLGEIRRDPRLLPADGTDGEQRTQDQAEYRRIFRRYLVDGTSGLEPEERHVLRRGFVSNGEQRAAMASQPGSAGGYAIPTGFAGYITENMLWYGGMRQASRLFPTATGNEIPFPTNDDTGNKGRRVGENQAATTTPLTLGQRWLRSYIYSSDIILVPLALMQDEQVDLEQYIARKAAERIGRIENQEQTTGTGAAQPNGLITAASVGKTTASATAITYGELVDLEHSIDVAYRNAARAGQAVDPQNRPPHVGYMFNDLVLAYLRKLADSQGRPLWVPQISAGLTTGVPATFNGWPYVINNDMASTVTASAVTAAFGNFEGYLIRDVGDITLMRLDERYADNLQVGFLAFHRMDSNLIDTSAVKTLTQHS